MRNHATRRGAAPARAVLYRHGMKHLALLVVAAASLAGCDKDQTEKKDTPAAPTAAAVAAPTPTTAAAPAPAAAAAPAADAGPPKIGRWIPGEEAVAAAPYSRGDYLVALDYRDEGYGTYGFLFHGDNKWWFVENDEVVGGPHADGGPEMQKVIAAWTAHEKRRHDTVMQGIAALPHGCLDGCAFDVYQNGRYVGTRIEY